MIKSVLVVCVGNICRSPAGERLLAKSCPSLRVESAGIAALEGHAADATMAEIAAENGLSLANHVARQFTAELAAEFDLILALEKGHIRVITQKAPAASGKVMLLGQWLDTQEIADPYQKSRTFYTLVFEQVKQACAAWAPKLGMT
jgi:protein-tyrosine phosphatase